MVIECPGCLAEVPFWINASTVKHDERGVCQVSVNPIVAEHHCPVPKAA